MKRILLMAVLALALGWSFFGHKSKPSKTEKTFSVIEQKPFVIITPSFNNTKWCEKNLASVFEQTYDNYRLIYIDDCSTDGTADKVKEIIARFGKADKVQLIRNEVNKGAMENFYHAVHSCSDQEIVVCLDGDDWLAHDKVLERLNEFYANPDVWLAYGGYREYPSYSKGVYSKQLPPQVINNNKFREYSFSTSHIRTFYAGLFKQIKSQDLSKDGRFVQTSCDVAMMIPMLEMAGNKIFYIKKDILYIYNHSNPLNDDVKRWDNQWATKEYIKALPKYHPIASFQTVQKPFVVITPSFNNSKWCEKNLASVFEQTYDNYRLIYIDDCSTDGTADKVQEIIGRWGKGDKVQLIRNETNKGAMENLYHAIHSCSDQEIVVCLDGDDWLAHDKVLERLNEFYANPDVWLAYGGYREYPSYNKGVYSKQLPARVINKNKFREHPWSTSHIRTFYAGLFKQIKLQDLFKDGKCVETAYDIAMMMPMLEMAGKKIFYIKKDIFYIYNHANPLNDDLNRARDQVATQEYIRALPKYQPLASFEKKSEPHKSDLVIFSFDGPMQLYALLESAYKYVENMGGISVIYRVSLPEFSQGYDRVKKKFPNVKFLEQGQEPQKDFKPLVLQAVRGSSADHIAFVVDDVIVKDSIDLHACIQAMEETQAYGFYLRLGQHVDYCYMQDKPQEIPHLTKVGEAFAWQFGVGEGDWKYPNTLDFAVYRKKDVIKRLEKMEFHNPKTLEVVWAEKGNTKKKVGLCFAGSKVVNIPLNLTEFSSNRVMNSYSREELLKRFLEGFKIDITPFHQIENKSAHIEYNVAFVGRDDA
jgi:glycosyltransferase involved in cell wall biosynthesis